MKRILTLLLLLSTSLLYSQATLTDLNLVFDILASNNVTSSTFEVEGAVFHSTTEYSGLDVQVGDLVYFQDGPTTYSLPIQSITTQNYSYIKVVLVDESSTVSYVPTGRAAIVSVSDPNLLPVPPDGIPQDLATGILNDLRLKIQIGVNNAEEITDYIGSVDTPPAYSASLHSGETWRNSVGQLFYSNGTQWLTDKEILLTNTSLLNQPSSIYKLGIDTSGVNDVIYVSNNNIFKKLEVGGTLTGEVITVADTTQLDTVHRVQFYQYPIQSGGERILRWNDTDGTLDLGLKGGNVTLQLGQKQVSLVKHADNSGLANGKVVYLVGSDGQNKTVRYARANSEATSAVTFGLMTESSTGGNKAFTTTFGLVRNINTSNLTEGKVVWLSADTAGAMTAVRPIAPNHGVMVGFCVRKHATQGVIFVEIQNGYELDELHNVHVPSPSDNQALVWIAANSRWEARTIDTDPSDDVTGSGADGQVSFWTGLKTQSGDNNLFWNNTDKRLGIGTNTPTTQLEVQSANLTGVGTLSSEILNTSGWATTGWTGNYTTGFTHTPGTTTPLTNTLDAVPNTYYQLVVTSSGQTTGTFTVSIGGFTPLDPISAVGAATFGFMATTTDSLTVTPSSNFNGTLLISLKSVISTGATQSWKNSSGSVVTEFRASNSSTNTFLGFNSATRNTAGLNNVGIGTEAFYNSVAPTNSVAIGYQTLSSSDSEGSVAIGYQALRDNTRGHTNTAIGRASFRATSTGFGNVGIGAYTGVTNTTGFFNVAIGYFSFQANTSGYYNVAIGNRALRSNTTGQSNLSIGQNSLFLNTTGSSNTAFGGSALYRNTSGSNNTGLGNNSLNNIDSGNFNLGIGSSAGSLLGDNTANTTSSNSIFIGYNTKSKINNQTNQIVIGDQVTGLGSNTTVLGNSSTTQTWLGGSLTLGTQISPLARLHVSAAGTTGSIGAVLVTDNATTPANLFEVRANGDIYLNKYPNTLNTTGNPVNVLSTGTDGLLQSHPISEVISAGGAITSITGGTGISVSTVSGASTITNTAPDQTVSITGAGINTVSGTYPNFTITGTEVDGSTTNELQTLSTGTNTLTLSNGGGTVTVDTDPASDVTGSGVLNYLPQFNSTSSIDTTGIIWVGGRMGVGITAPQDVLDVNGVIRTNGGFKGISEGAKSFFIDRYSTNAFSDEFAFRKARGTIAAPLRVMNDDEMGAVEFYGYDSIGFRMGAQIRGFIDGVTSGGFAPGRLSFYTNSGNTTGYGTERMRLNSSGNLLLGATTGSARLHVRGSGTTSSTTALLVQNGATTPANLLSVLDNGNVGIGTAAPAVALDVFGRSIIGSSYAIPNVSSQYFILSSNDASRSISNNTGSSNANYTGYGKFFVDYTGADAFTSGTGLLTGANNRNTNANNNITGAFFIVTNDVATAKAGTLTALRSYLANSSTTSLSNAIGLDLDMGFNDAASVITNYYGARVRITTNSGVMTNTYGFFVDDITKGTQTNTPFSFYASDANALNYFAGNTGIGVTAPSRTLDINGETRIRDLTTTTATNLVGSDADGVLSNVTFASAVSQGGGLTGNGVSPFIAQYNSSNTLDTTGIVWNGGRMGVGLTTTSPSARLEVRGIGSTSASNTVQFKNGTGTNIVTLTDDGSLLVGLTTPSSGITKFETNSRGRFHGGIELGATASARLDGNGNYFRFVGSADGFGFYNDFQYNPTSGSYYWAEFSTPIVISSGSAAISILRLRPVINLTGTATTNVIGLDYNPTLTSLASGRNIAALFRTGQVGIGTGTGTPDLSAALDITSTTQGVLFPRMTTTQRNAISSPAAGLTIYNTTDGVMQHYNGSTWTDERDNVNGLSGLGVTNYLAQYNSSNTLDTTGVIWTGGRMGIGTATPSARLNVFGSAANHGVSTNVGYNIQLVTAPTFLTTDLTLQAGGVMTPGQHFICVAYYNAFGQTELSARRGITTTVSNASVLINLPISPDPTVIGRRVFLSNVGEGSSYGKMIADIPNNTQTTYLINVADDPAGTPPVFSTPNLTSNYISVNGTRSLVLSSSLVTVGPGNGNANITGPVNIIVGSISGTSITTGGYNTILGSNIGNTITTGTGNFLVGINTGQLTTGSDNIFLGRFVNQYGGGALNYNTAMGYAAMRDLNSGEENIAIGRSALGSLDRGSSNVAIGSYAASTIDTLSSNNVFIGVQAGSYVGATGSSSYNTVNSSIFIGNTTRTLADNLSNQIVIGNNSTTLGNNTTRVGNTSTIQTHLDGRLTIGNTFYDSRVAARIVGADVSSTNYSLVVTDSDGGTSTTVDPNLVVRNDGLVGINTYSPARRLHVNGEARITDLTTDTPTRIVGADTDGDLGEITLGSGLSITSGTISVTNPISASEVFIESSTATTIDLDANTGVVKDVNGTNASFTYPTDLSRLSVYKNGIRLSRTGTLTTRDFSVNTTTNEITFTTALLSTDRIVIVKI